MTTRDRLAAIEARDGKWTYRRDTNANQACRDRRWLVARLRRAEALLRCTTDQDPRWMRTIEDFLDGAEDESK